MMCHVIEEEVKIRKEGSQGECQADNLVAFCSKYEHRSIQKGETAIHHVSYYAAL